MTDDPYQTGSPVGVYVNGQLVSSSNPFPVSGSSGGGGGSGGTVVQGAPGAAAQGWYVQPGNGASFAVTGTVGTKPPSGTGAAISGATTIAAASTYQTLTAAGEVVTGFYVMNPSTNTVPLYVDPTGATGTTLIKTSIPVSPGQMFNSAFTPTNAVTVFATSAISFIAGRF